MAETEQTKSGIISSQTIMTQLRKLPIPEQQALIGLLVEMRDGGLLASDVSPPDLGGAAIQASPRPALAAKLEGMAQTLILEDYPARSVSQPITMKQLFLRELRVYGKEGHLRFGDFDTQSKEIPTGAYSLYLKGVNDPRSEQVKIGTLFTWEGVHPAAVVLPHDIAKKDISFADLYSRLIETFPQHCPMPVAIVSGDGDLRALGFSK